MLTNNDGAQQQSMLAIQAVPDASAIRTSELAGDEYTVIPCVCLVEGVLWPANAPSPELALAEEFGRFPDGWNGRPVVLNHPREDGIAVSASKPAVLENALGQIFNTVLEDKKLKTEIWINDARVAELDEEFRDAVDRLKNGDEVVEVSTGLFTMQERVTGEFEGEAYESIWRNIVPDHLAILPEGLVGACSVEDGCGAPRLNEDGTEAPTYTPVMNAVSIGADACSCEDEPTEGMWSKLLSNIGDAFSFRGTSAHLSDSDLRAALNAGLNAAESDRYFFILAVFQDGDDAGVFVYELGFDGTLYSRQFSVDSGSGVVTIGEDRISVRPETRFVPVEVTTNVSDNNGDVNNPEISERTAQEIAMDKEQLVSSLIANEATNFTDDDKEWLTELEDSQLERMVPVVASQTPEELAQAEQDAALQAERDRQEAAATASSSDNPVTTEQYIASAPADVQAVLNEGLSMQKARKEHIVKAVLANTRNRFTEEELNAKSLGELENIAALSNVVTFEGNGSPVLLDTDADDERITPAPSILDNLAQSS